MENRIDQLVTLANGKKYVIINQAIYQNNTYFYASEVTEDEENITGTFAIFEQIKQDGKEYLKLVTDQKTVQLLIKYLQPSEE